MRRKKHFNDCKHKGFGVFCHTCTPNKPRNRKKALAGAYGPKVQQKEERIKGRKS